MNKKIKIMFVCYGNICRSPMAEFIMKDLVSEKGESDLFYIASAATSDEGLNCPVHRGTAKILDRMGIDYSQKRGVRLKKADYGEYDYFIGMDEMNRRDMKKIFGGDDENKISLLLDYTDEKRDVADPWWTGDFEKTFVDVVNGTRGFYAFLKALKN